MVARSSDRSLVGSRVGNVTIVDLLGTGGMGAVYLGFDDKLTRKVAVKTLRADFAAQAADRSRFLREARILSTLDHSGICRIYDVVDQGGVDHLILELVEGKTLGQAAADGLDTERKLEIIEQIALSLDAALEEMIAQLGTIAEGPGHFAIGCGWMALHEYRRARQHLDQAWQAGHREPEVAYALGITYGELYSAALSDALALGNPQAQKDSRERARRELRDPALRYLGSCQGSSQGYPDYVHGLIAVYEERYDDAVRLADRAIAARPWFYQGELLAAVALQRKANALKVSRPDNPEVLRWIQAAIERFQAAQATGRSDPRVLIDANWALGVLSNLLIEQRRLQEASKVLEAQRESEAVLEILNPTSSALFRSRAFSLVDQARIVILEDGDPEELFEAAVADMTHSVELAPDLSPSYSGLGWIYQWYADYQMQTGQDARGSLEAAIGAYKSYHEREPGMVDGHFYLAATNFRRALNETWYGGDPLPWTEQGSEAARRCVAVAPDMHSCWQQLANLSYVHGYYACRHGLEADTAFQEAIAAYRKITGRGDDRDPTGSVAMACLELGTCRCRRGEDPTADYQRAIVSLDGLADDELQSRAWFVLGLANLGLAKHVWRRGGNPDHHVLQALEAYRKGQRKDPRNLDAYAELAEIHRFAADVTLKRDNPGEGMQGVQEARDHLQSARRAVEAGLERNPHFPALYLARGRVEILEARCRLRNRSSPEAPFQKAAAAIETALRTHGDDPQAPLAAANLHLWRARWLHGMGENASESIGTGLQYVTHALRIDPSLAAAEAQRAWLLDLKAHVTLSSSTAEVRAAARAEVRAAAERAIELNRFLKRELAPLLPDQQADS